MNDTKLDLADLNYSRVELLVRSLGFVAALAVPWQIVFSCVSAGGAIQLQLHTLLTIWTTGRLLTNNKYPIRLTSLYSLTFFFSDSEFQGIMIIDSESASASNYVGEPITDTKKTKQEMRTNQNCKTKDNWMAISKQNKARNDGKQLSQDKSQTSDMFVF